MRAFRELGRKDIDIDMFSDLTFLLGDFNFRLNTTYSAIIEEVDKIFNFSALDQLHIVREKNVDFIDFEVRLLRVD